MLGCQAAFCRARLLPALILSCLWIAPATLLGTRADAQTAQAAAPNEWSAWVFVRAGAGWRVAAESATGVSAQRLVGLSAGAAASRGMAFGMLRAAYNERLSFDTPDSGVQDYAALAGVRSRGDHLIVTSAAGFAVATPIGGDNGLNSLHPDRQLAVAYDVSAHADRRFGGIAFSLSGVVGPARVRYVALSLDAELGRFRTR